MTDRQMLSIGILGLGPAGLAMLPYIKAHPRIRLGAVGDQRPEALQLFEQEAGVACFSDAAALCRCADIDAVFVATPTGLHAEHAIAALRAGKHVIVEKPMAITLEEADAMIAAARENQRALIVGHSQSFEPAIQLMRAAIESGRFGALKAINGWNYTDWVYRPRLPAELDRSKGGGVVYRQAAHHADIVRYLAGANVRSVRAAVSSWDTNRMTDGSYSAFLDFDNGVAATLFYSGYDHFPATELTFGIGENGRPAPSDYAAARRHTNASSGAASPTKHTSGLALQMERLAPGAHPAFFGIVLASCERADLRIEPDGVRIYADESRHLLPIDGLPVGRTAVLNELLEAADGHATTHGGAWGRANLETCRAILASSSQGAEVRLAVAEAEPLPVPAAVRNHFETYWQCP
jgi:phthalate 4,5-cis-dihydrodiol dehydrogenase